MKIRRIPIRSRSLMPQSAWLKSKRGPDINFVRLKQDVAQLRKEILLFNRSKLAAPIKPL